jgi:uncharacterized ion transporter superfamily protein YfcC
MGSKSGVQISQKAFLQSLILLFALMVLAGILTRTLPAGTYARTTQNGRELIQPDSFAYTARPDYPIWRWFTAPVEVLGGPDGLTIGVIIVFLLMVGTAFAVMERSGILKASLGGIVRRFGGQKYLLLLVLALFFMCLGAFFGIFEEVVPLVPLMIALAYSLGWDTFVGLGMSILATNVGFSAAITNPFTIGVAQKLAGLPLFSGAGLRLVIFAACYLALAVFLVRYARKVERDPQASPVFPEEQKERQRYGGFNLDQREQRADLRRAGAWLGVFLALILTCLLAAPFVPFLTDYGLPVIGLAFFAGGVGAGFLSGTERKALFQAMGEGALGIAPAIPLILMAASIKYIVAAGGIIDTTLHAASTAFTGTNPFVAALLVYVIALLIEFLVASGSAKAVLLMPLLVPLADLVSVTRQTTVTAYCFGDGFTNLAYPTNPVLIICLGLTVISYPKWIKWLAPLWAWILLLTVAFLGLAVVVHYGPM